MWHIKTSGTIWLALSFAWRVWHFSFWSRVCFAFIRRRWHGDHREHKARSPSGPSCSPLLHWFHFLCACAIHRSSVTSSRYLQFAAWLPGPAECYHILLGRSIVSIHRSCSPDGVRLGCEGGGVVWVFFSSVSISCSHHHLFATVLR